jgi:diadenosine tetraphosphate (Ap4A) HIT family hydrolase
MTVRKQASSRPALEPMTELIKVPIGDGTPADLPLGATRSVPTNRRGGQRAKWCGVAYPAIWDTQCPTEETAVMDRCMACDLADRTLPLPGGRIHETTHWLVEHCVGPLGLGTLIVKPRRHVTSVAELTDDEAHELGPLLRAASAVAGDLVPAEQVYNCLWSHAGGVPVHIHYVVQPVSADLMKRYGSHGPVLQVAMFSEGDIPPNVRIEDVADRARAAFGRRSDGR